MSTVFFIMPGRSRDESNSAAALGAPAAAGVAALAFLALGTRVGWKRALEAANKPRKGHSTSVQPARVVVDPSTGMTAGQLASKAFLYGTALATGTAAVITTGLVFAWDVHSVSAYQRCCRPQRRGSRAFFSQAQEFADNFAVRFEMSKERLANTKEWASGALWRPLACFTRVFLTGQGCARGD